MTTPKKPLSKTESAIQLGNILKGGARGGGSKKGIIRKIKKLLKIGEKPSKVSKTKKIGEVQTRPKKSLQNQKPDKSPKSSDWDAAMYNQPRGHGKRMGTRASIQLETKYPKAAKVMHLKRGQSNIQKSGKKSFKIQPKPTKK